MKFQVPQFLSPYLAKGVVVAGRILPINIVKGVALLMATATGDAVNVKRLAQKVRSETLPLSLQYAILNESLNNILLLSQWAPKNGVNRPKETQAVQTFEIISSVPWDVTPADIRDFFNQLVNSEFDIPRSVDVGSLAVKLCTQQKWSADHKRSTFSQLCRQFENSLKAKYGPSDDHLPMWAITEIYKAWRMELSGDSLVPILSNPNTIIAQRSKNKLQPSTLTLLEHCVVGAPETVLLSMLTDCISPKDLNACSKIFDRPNLSDDLLHAFITKGMDVSTVLNKRYGYRKPNATLVELYDELADDSSHAIETLKNVEERIASETQKAVLVAVVEDHVEFKNQPTLGARRKM